MIPSYPLKITLFAGDLMSAEADRTLLHLLLKLLKRVCSGV